MYNIKLKAYWNTKVYSNKSEKYYDINLYVNIFVYHHRFTDFNNK